MERSSESQIHGAHFSIYFIFEWVEKDVEIQSIEPKCNFFTHIHNERTNKQKNNKLFDIFR